jgi:iron complex transport system ATP-binding protein
VSITVKNLSFAYGSHKVLDDINFTANEGEMVYVLGANGAGKSTLFRCILGLTNNHGGEVQLNGHDIREFNSRQLASQMAYIPQGTSPTFPYSVEESILMGRVAFIKPFHLPGKKDYALVRDAMRQLNIEKLAQKSFKEISGGEQQLVIIARALVQQTKILIMDEPTSSLDFGNQLRVLRKVKELSKKGYLVILSSHNPEHAFLFADRVLAIADGKVAGCGKPEEVLTKKLMQKLYNEEVDIGQVQWGERTISYCLPALGGENGSYVSVG